MPYALLGVRLDQPVILRLIVDGELDDPKKVVIASPLPQRGLDVDFVV